MHSICGVLISVRIDFALLMESVSSSFASSFEGGQSVVTPRVRQIRHQISLQELELRLARLGLPFEESDSSSRGQT